MQSILNDTDKDIIKNFKEQFSHIKNEPIVLYGLGEKTKLLLDNLLDYNFVALMDKNSIGATVYNLPVIAPENVSKISKNIIIVCMYASKDIILKRISGLIKENISIYYMNGEKLGRVEESKKEIKSFGELKQMIDENDIISFDIFDTLIIRKTLNPTDIFEIVEKKGIKDFVSKRIEAEKKAQKVYGEFYTVKNIYEFIEDKFAMQIETETEYEMSFAKTDIVNLCNYAIDSSKKVLITSDMYLPKDLILKMLDKINLKRGYILNLSNETKLSKYSGKIYEKYKGLYKNSQILHIGDDEFSDIEQAKKHNINTFYLPKTKNILIESLNTVEDKMLLGEIYAKCDNPFSDKLACNSMLQFGCFVAPLVLNYMNWLYKKAKQDKIDKILFIARDGYLLEQIYKFYPEPKPKGVYFYTSRRCLGVCSIKNEKDIIEAFNIYYMARKITIEKFVSSAFGIDIKNEFAQKYLNEISKQDVLNFVIKNMNLILENANEEQTEYKKYSDTLIKLGEKIAMINFVSSGSTQFFAEKVIDKMIKVYCFQTTSDIKKLNINFNNLQTLYGDFASPFTSDSALSKHYHTLEALLTSPEEQFVKFMNGEKIFLGNRNNNFDNIKDSHTAIIDFITNLQRNNKNWYELNWDSKFIENILGLLYKDEYVSVGESLKNKFKIRDGFSCEKEVVGLW